MTDILPAYERWGVMIRRREGQMCWDGYEVKMLPEMLPQILGNVGLNLQAIAGSASSNRPVAIG